MLPVLIPRASENIAVFPGATNPTAGPARRVTSAEAPPRNCAAAGEDSRAHLQQTAADMLTLATILRRLEPIARRRRSGSRSFRVSS